MNKPLVICGLVAFFVVIGLILFRIFSSPATDPGALQGFVVSGTSFAIGSDGQKAISGSLRNPGDRVAENIGVMLKLFGSDGAEMGGVEVLVPNIAANSFAQFSVPVQDSVEGYCFVNAKKR